MALLTHVSAAGARYALVTIEALIPPSGGGFPVETWAPLVTTFMQRVDLMGAEAYRADQLSARYDVRWVGPYLPALDPELVDVPATHRLRHRDKVYDVIGAVTVGNYEGIEYRAIAHSEA